MGWGKIVSSVSGELGRNTPKNRVVNAEFVDLKNGSGRNGNNGIRALALHPEAGALLQSYYGIDLASLPGMSPEELGDLVDFLRQAEWMDTHLDKLRDHFKKYIDRQTDFNKFIAEITKAGLKGAETIDKSGLDTYLLEFRLKASDRNITPTELRVKKSLSTRGEKFLKRKSGQPC